MTAGTTRDPATVGPYRLIRKLGEGGMGVVHLAVDPAGRAVALKVLRAHVANDDEARRRLAREVATLRRVRHPQIAEVLDADVSGDEPYLVTRFVPGRSLEDEVRSNGPLSAGQVARIGRGLAGALSQIHAAGVVHRDLKPANVMMVDGEPVLIDFGIAHMADESRITRTGLVMGTPGYLSPELIYGDPVTAATDWWAWGATLAFASTGRQPFGTGPIEAILERVRRGASDLDGVEPHLGDLLRRTLTVDASRRPTAAELLAGLDQVVAAVTTAPTQHAPNGPSGPDASRPDPDRQDRDRQDRDRQDRDRQDRDRQDRDRQDRAPSHRADTLDRPPRRPAALPAAAAYPPPVPYPPPSQARPAARSAPAVPYPPAPTRPEPARDPYPPRSRPLQPPQPSRQTGHPAPGYPPAGYAPVPGHPQAQPQGYPPGYPAPGAQQPNGQAHPYGPPYAGPQTHPAAPTYPYGPPYAGAGYPGYPTPHQGGTQYPPTTPLLGRAAERAGRPARRPSVTQDGPRRVTGTLAAGMAALCLIAAVAPGTAIVVALLAGVVARTVERSTSGLERRRAELGRSRTDVAVTVAALPLRLLRAVLVGVVAAILPLLVTFSVAFIAGNAIGLHGAMYPSRPVPLVLGMVAGLGTAWWGPGGWGLRTGTRAVARTLTASRTGEITGYVFCALVAAAVVIMLLQGDVSPDWTPFTPPSQMFG